MSLLTLRNISLSFGEFALLDRVNLTIDKGERLCLVGRNGSGKSTLMKLIQGQVLADRGERECPQGLRIARMEQEVPADTDATIHAMIAKGLGETGDRLERFQALSEATGDDVSDELASLQEQLDSEDGWSLAQRVDKVLSLLLLEGDQPFSGLSGGMKRRVLLGRALVQEPDILLLDEPTNHLDLDAIKWLEQFLKTYRTTLLFITHDRAFLRSLATRIIELDRGQLTSWPGNYDTYLTRKAAALEAEAKQQAEFDKKLSQEERWIRQGIKARRTRNEGRVRALHAMRQEYANRHQRQGKVKLAIQDTESSGKLMIETRNLGYAHDSQPIVKDLNWKMQRGDRIGILGPNGCGKSTLIRLLLKQISPQKGSVRHGSRLEPAYFDQLRDKLDPDETLLDNLAKGSDSVTINGKSRHVMSYLQDFLFTPARARQPVSALSGGERNRLLLAKVFARPFNLLVLDEPTNDLDVETLELLEDHLQQYQGSLLLVSHDRAFIEATVTSTLVWEDGQWNSYVGGYEDWLRQRPTQTPSPESNIESSQKPARAPARKTAGKLTYAERLELEALPDQLEELETKVTSLEQQLNDPSLYQGSQLEKREALNQQLTKAQTVLDASLERWAELEEAEAKGTTLSP